ncbi:TlpA disulfide reductase family protein [Pusillimonas sp. NJUB218]|uniref:TlpA family protein disulfide reductase n=1 Tax=Pusillimonas sp. NJUB218 TaxID=2023230 RepID=UPI000F4BD0A4|nr:TlpA disulfide reductase family protein [Pusillimonas sp. NJUB218]ROT44811.1 thioredoxin [Pusillimonas sp. NJUB218]
MMMRRKFLQRCLGMFAAGLLAVGGLPHAVASSAGLFGLQFPDSDGTPVPLDQWRGGPVVVNFWATWCPPCVKEMPDLEALKQKYPGVQFVGLGVDTAANIKKFIPKVNVTYPLLVTGYGGIDLMKTLGNPTGGLPYTLVYDASGNVLERIMGQVKPDHLDAILQRVSKP